MLLVKVASSLVHLRSLQLTQVNIAIISHPRKIERIATVLLVESGSLIYMGRIVRQFLLLGSTKTVKPKNRMKWTQLLILILNDLHF